MFMIATRSERAINLRACKLKFDEGIVQNEMFLPQERMRHVRTLLKHEGAVVFEYTKESLTHTLRTLLRSGR